MDISPRDLLAHALVLVFEYVFSSSADGVIRKKSIAQKRIADGHTHGKTLGTTYAPPANSLLQPSPAFVLTSLLSTNQPHQPAQHNNASPPGNQHRNGHVTLLEQNRKRKFSSLPGLQTDGWGIPFKGRPVSNTAVYTGLKKKRLTHSAGSEDSVAAISIEANQSDLLNTIHAFIRPGL